MKRASKTRITEGDGSDKGTTGGKSWAETDGTGDRDGFLGFTGAIGQAISLMGTLSLLICCPAIVILL